MNKLCPNCNFTVGPMVYMSAAGGTHNVLYCMNCGWTSNITAEEAAAFEVKHEDVSLNDHQWELILNFMDFMLSPGFNEEQRAKIHIKVRKELAAIHVRTSYPSQPSMPSVPEGFVGGDLAKAVEKSIHLDLEQDPKG